MADSYWRYNDGRQPPHQAPRQPVTPVSAKRLRTDFDVPGGHDLASYLPRDDIRGAAHGVRDTESIDASYERYLRNSQISSYVGGQSSRPISGGISSFPLEDRHVGGLGGVDQGIAVKDRTLEFEGRRPEILLPPDATSTLFVEGLPSNCTRREVSHIFRPFVGYKEVRLVNKESRHSVDPLVLCFVDFVSPAHAATALDALQGYIFDENDRNSVRLRLQFARYPGARSGGGHRGKR